MIEVSLAAEAGRATGTRPARRLRRDGRVPAVLYGHGIEAASLAVDARSLRAALSTEAGVNALITITLDGSRHLAMARQLQRHPVKGTVEHVDFVIVRRDEVVPADVPVHLVGEADRVVRLGGMVEQALFSLTVHARPGDLPSSIDVDVSGLSLGDTVRVGDLRLPGGVTTELDPDEPVVSTMAARVALPGEEAGEAGEAAEARGEAAGGGTAGAGGGGDAGGA